MDSYGFWFVLIHLACGFICARIAEKKNRSATGGFFAGLFFGVIGIIVYARLDSK